MTRRLNHKNFYFIFFLLFLAGCVATNTHHRVLDQEEIIETEIDEALSTPLFTDLPWPEEGWWKLFNDPTLETLITQALIYSPTSEKATLLVKRALANVKVAKSALYPLIYGAGDIIPTLYTRTGIFPPNPFIPFHYTETDLTLNLDYELDLWHQNQNTFRAEKDLLFAELQNRNLIQLILSISVAEAYFALKVTQRIESFSRQIVENRAQKYDLIAQKVQNSLENQLVLLNAEQNLLTAKNSLAEVERSREIQEHALATLVGDGNLLPYIDSNFELESLFPFPLPECIALDVLSRRPDIQAQLWRIDSQAQIVRVKAADFYPNFNISAFVGFSTIFPGKLFNSKSTEREYGPAFHLPIFPQEVLRANLTIAQENFHFAVEEYNQLILNAVQQVLDALTSVKKLNQEWKIAEALQQSANDTLALVKMRQARLSSALDLLDQEQATLTIETQKALIEEQLLTSLLNMIKALGG